MGLRGSRYSWVEAVGYNPSVTYGDSSLYTREPFYSTILYRNLYTLYFTLFTLKRGRLRLQRTVEDAGPYFSFANKSGLRLQRA